MDAAVILRPVRLRISDADAAVILRPLRLRISDADAAVILRPLRLLISDVIVDATLQGPLNLSHVKKALMGKMSMYRYVQVQYRTMYRCRYKCEKNTASGRGASMSACAGLINQLQICQFNPNNGKTLTPIAGHGGRG